MKHCVVSWCDFSSFSFNGIIFFFSKLITSAECSLREIENIFCSKRMKTIYTIKIGIMVVPVINADSFLLQDNASLFH